MNTPPVLVVGIGGAGCSVLASVAELVSQEGLSDRFRLVAIDSTSRSLRDVEPVVDETYHLNVDQEAVADDYTSLEYLRDQYEIIPDAGTSRRRPLGRYLIDSAADTAGLIEFFQASISSLIESGEYDSSEPVYVWVVNSLSGGTGSGAMPLTAGLLEASSRNIDNPVELFGVGSLPRLDELDHRVQKPEGEPVHYANAYTALAEIRRLMDLDGETEYPLEFEVNRRATGVRVDSLSIGENPFSGYWLIGVNEAERLRASYFNHVNDLISRLIYYVSSIEDYGWFEQGTLYSAAGATLEPPFEDLEEYHEARQALGRLETELAALRDRRKSLQDADRFIQDVLEVSHDISSGRENEKTAHESPVDDSIVSACRREVNILSLDETYSVDEWVADRAETLAAELDGRFPEQVPESLVIRYLLAVSALDWTRSELASHSLTQYLEQLEDRWLPEQQDERDERHPDIDDTETTFSEWAEAVLSDLQAHEMELRRDATDSVFPTFLTSHGQQLAELERQRRRAESMSDEYARLESMESTLVTQRERTRSKLIEYRDTLEKERAAKRAEWDRVQQRWTRHAQHRSQVRDRLEKIRVRGARLYPPVDSLETEADTAPWTADECSLATLVSADVVDRTALLETFERAVLTLDEPVEDLAESTYGITSGRLGIIAPETDRELLRGEVLHGSDGTDSLLRELYYRFEAVDELVHWNHDTAIFLLACYRPVSLEYTSEFGTVHEYFQDAEDDVKSLLGSVTDSEIDRRFAYPELVQ
ncbi:MULTISPECIES: tubulin-like doman-containing protein [Haloferax]|uniref:Tubulin like n=1 Tax=Haloferax marinum TaxID=2666143 RepID=A0A6A8GEG1_9EURY|nr:MULTISPECIES: tubulin-like doman-containing protein [Haloferax]KAB1190647.1 hypothetical protein Hfx1150_16545 [Haloferax sp. CBA1150]MRW98176.1 hypothetical protein [Haloferax marinum]